MKKPDTSISSSSKITFDESEEPRSSLEDEREIERQLVHATFEELLQARSNGSQAVLQSFNKEKVGRANKNRPREAIATRPVRRFREVVQAPKMIVRDPRFESLCGILDVDGFKQRYDFLYHDKFPAEKQELLNKLRKTKDPMAIDELKNRVSWIDNQMRSGPPKLKDTKILSQHKKKEREATKLGKRPYYLKKSEIRKQALKEKYNSLKNSGKLESFIQKKRKKNASKDHRYMPYRRPNEHQD